MDRRLGRGAAGARRADTARAGGYPTAAALAGVVLALLGVILAGCGEDGGDSSTGAPSTARSPDSSPATQTTAAGTEANAEGLPAALGSPKAVRLAVEAVLTADEPAKACGKYVTRRYVRVSYGSKEGCVQAQRPGSAARSLASFRIGQEGGQGTVVEAFAVPRGGPYGGSRLTIGLVFSGDHYRVDRLNSDVPVGP